MDNEAADEGDIIESSQIPNLRENVRKRRIFYGPPKIEKRRKINRTRQQNNATVSQCMQREWKSPRVNKRLDQINPGADEFIKFSTQQDEGKAIDRCPSVNLFEQQKDIVQRYMFSETTEAQQEEMLDQILQGFRTSYEQASARIADSSPVPAAMVNMLPKMVEDGPRLEPNTTLMEMEICCEPPDLVSQLPTKANVGRHVPPASATAKKFCEPLVPLASLPKERSDEKDKLPVFAIERTVSMIEMEKFCEPIMQHASLPKERNVERDEPPVPAMEPTVSMIEIEKLCEPIMHLTALPKDRKDQRDEPLMPAMKPTVGTIEMEKSFESITQLAEQPKARNVERAMPTMLIDGCLDLSTKRDKSNSYQVRKETNKKRQHVSNNHFNEVEFIENDNGILELHNPHLTLIEEKRMRTKEYVLQHSEKRPKTQQKIASQRTNKQALNTVDNATQTHRGQFFCNVGVQHSPVGSFDMTNYNVIMLARLVGINPNSLYTKIRQMIRASDSRMLWQPRKLSRVFTENDPYYANLDYFMSPRL